jgi:hypothetical protein
MYYPYSQAPKVDTQHQAENGVSGDNPTNHRPASQVHPSDEQQRERHGDNATEIFGIKPGEWLLSIVTLMLWGATVSLVRGADNTASAQLRAYVSVETGVNCRQSQQSRTQFEFRPIVRNNGLTPAKNVRIISLMDIVQPSIPRGFNYAIQNVAVTPFSSVTTIGPRQERFHSRVMGRYLTVGELRDIRRGTKCFHVWGRVEYDDIFGQPHQTNFSFMIFVGRKRDATIWHNTEENNDAT